LFKLDDTIEVKLIQLSDKNYAITFDDRTNEELSPLLEQWQEEKQEELRYVRRIN
jgi:hypothetical protein